MSKYIWGSSSDEEEEVQCDDHSSEEDRDRDEDEEEDEEGSDTHYINERIRRSRAPETPDKKPSPPARKQPPPQQNPKAPQPKQAAPKKAPPKQSPPKVSRKPEASARKSPGQTTTRQALVSKRRLQEPQNQAELEPMENDNQLMRIETKYGESTETAVNSNTIRQDLVDGKQYFQSRLNKSILAIDGSSIKRELDRESYLSDENEEIQMMANIFASNDPVEFMKANRFESVSKKSDLPFQLGILLPTTKGNLVQRFEAHEQLQKTFGTLKNGFNFSATRYTKTSQTQLLWRDFFFKHAEGQYLGTLFFVDMTFPGDRGEPMRAKNVIGLSRPVRESLLENSFNFVVSFYHSHSDMISIRTQSHSYVIFNFKRLDPSQPKFALNEIVFLQVGNIKEVGDEDEDVDIKPKKSHVGSNGGAPGSNPLLFFDPIESSINKHSIQHKKTRVAKKHQMDMIYSKLGTKHREHDSIYRYDHVLRNHKGVEDIIDEDNDKLQEYNFMQIALNFKSLMKSSAILMHSADVFERTIAREKNSSHATSILYEIIKLFKESPTLAEAIKSYDFLSYPMKLKSMNISFEKKGLIGGLKNLLKSDSRNMELRVWEYDSEKDAGLFQGVTIIEFPLSKLQIRFKDFFKNGKYHANYARGVTFYLEPEKDLKLPKQFRLKMMGDDRELNANSFYGLVPHKSSSSLDVVVLDKKEGKEVGGEITSLYVIMVK
jgi:hypothetical protein